MSKFSVFSFQFSEKVIPKPEWSKKLVFCEMNLCKAQAEVASQKILRFVGSLTVRGIFKGLYSLKRRN